ncbi:MAG: VWA domain-containing protein, partial [Clostridia bacterium]|nr:VWA domain-containing protein [Clostridia bacterium]
VDFAGESMLVDPSSPQYDVTAINADATDIDKALRTASEALKEKARKRIILLTDGVFTDGDISVASQFAASHGIRLDAVYFNTNVETTETELTRFAIPADAADGQNFSASITALSNRKTQGVIGIYDGSTLVSEEEVAILPGENNFTYTLTAEEAGEHTYRAEYSSQDDAIRQNNTRYALMSVNDTTKVLIVDGTGTQSANLSELLTQGGYEVRVISCDQMPSTVSAMCEYGLIILMNADVDDMPEGSAGRLDSYVSEYGRSVLTTGGENTYIYGNMKDTPFEDFLPITMSVEEKGSTDPMALMIVMDTTDSMTRVTLGTPIEMARRGAIKCIDALNSNDYAGIITFADSAELLVNMTPMNDKDEIIAAINDIGTVGPDKLTMFTSALRMAADELKAFDKLDRKHVLFITDGSPADVGSGFENIVKEMSDNGITMSTIAVGKIVNVVKLLENLSSIGGGRCYYVESAYDLPDIMTTDTYLLQVDYTLEDPFIPVINRRVFEIDEAAVTQLFGYVRTGAKGSALVALSTSEGHPIYAQWDYEDGIAASFMSDLSGEWSRSWYANENGRQLILNMIKGLVPDTLKQAGVDIRLDAAGAYGVLSVVSELEGVEGILADITTPDNEKYSATLHKTGVNIYSNEIPIKCAGRYDVNLTWLDSQGAALETRETRVTHSWSAEYEVISRPDGNLALMDLCAGIGGAKVTSVDELLGIEIGTTPIAHDMTLALAILIALCLLADVVMRKTK